MTTLLIRNARIVDGSGGPSRHGDVAVRDGVIAAVGRDLPAAGAIAAAALYLTWADVMTGQVLSPNGGFAI